MLIFNVNKFILFVWELLLASMLVFPRILQIPKIIFCLTILVIGFFIRKKHCAGFYTLTYVIIAILHTIYTIIVGFYYGNASEAFIGSFRVGIINNFLLLLIISNVYSINNVLEKSLRVLVIANIYIGLYNIILLIAAFTGVDAELLRSFDATANIGLHEGYSHIVSTNLSMSLLTFPVCLFLSNYSKLNQFVSKKFIVFSLLVLGIAMLFSGRRILWGCLAISLFLYYFIEIKDIGKFVKRLMGVVFFGGVVIFGSIRLGFLSLDHMLNRFISAFGTSFNAVETIREIQARYLLEGFWENPIFGTGSGGIIPGFFRSFDFPWMFELSYHSLLFHSGIVGTLIYLSGLFVILHGIIKLKLFDKNLFRACFFSFWIIIIANATNPYFSSSFDFMILIYFFLFIIDSTIFIYDIKADF